MDNLITTLRREVSKIKTYTKYLFIFSVLLYSLRIRLKYYSMLNIYKARYCLYYQDYYLLER